MTTYIVTVNYPDLEFEAENEDDAIAQAVESILNNWDTRKYCSAEVKGERDYREALERRVKQ